MVACRRERFLLLQEISSIFVPQLNVRYFGIIASSGLRWAEDSPLEVGFKPV
jgi:hypothetical protein